MNKVLVSVSKSKKPKSKNPKSAPGSKDVKSADGKSKDAKSAADKSKDLKSADQSKDLKSVDQSKDLKSAAEQSKDTKSAAGDPKEEKSGNKATKKVKKVASKEPEWSHRSQNQWPAQFPISVTGKRQSPIDIRMCDATKEDHPPIKFELVGGSASKKWTLANNGHTFVASPPSGVKWQLSGGMLEGNYILEHFYGHWGESKGYGSEHLLDGQRFDGELQFIFKWGSGQGKEPEDSHVALGLLLTESDATSESVKNIFDDVLEPNLDKIVKVGNTKVPGMDLKKLGELRSGEEYFAYKGSLTMPPFSECVFHIVFKNPLNVTKALMDKFRSLDDLENEKNTINFRGLQPLMDRKVHFSVSKETPKDVKSKETKEAKETKSAKESKDKKEAKEVPKDSKETKETKENKDAKEAKDSKETKETKDTKEPKDSKETKETKDTTAEDSNETDES